MGSAPFTSELAERLSEDVLQRFLRYVRIDTQAADEATTYPSTARQLDLSRLLVEELRESGLTDAGLTEHGYVFATLPGTVNRPVVGLIAHVDTTPETPGAGVTPIVHEDYRGDPIVLPGDTSQVLDPAEEPALAARIGHDIVTSDGTTLLGADDKAGVAEIMAAVSYLAASATGSRAPVRVAFTVDEEIGRGTDHFDLGVFGADVAYTLDGSDLGELEIETFSAKAMRVTIRGRGAHPGSAKDKLVNAVKLAADFVASLPRDRLSPESTEEREGFVHPTRIAGGAEETVVTFIVRDHDDDKLEQHVTFLDELARKVEEREPRARVTVDVAETYRTCGPPSTGTRAWWLQPRRRFGERVSSRACRSSAGAPTAHACRPWACRPRTSSPAGRTTTRCASGRVSRTWRRPRRPSSSSSASGLRRQPGKPVDERGTSARRVPRHQRRGRPLRRALGVLRRHVMRRASGDPFGWRLRVVHAAAEPVVAEATHRARSGAARSPSG